MDYIQYAIEQLEKNNQGISAGRARDQYIELKNKLAQLEAVEQPLALDAAKSCQNCNHASICVQDEPGCILWSPRK